MAELEEWGRLILIGPEGEELGGLLVEAEGPPDLESVEQVARFVLLAVRLGGTAAFETLRPELKELLELAGLRVEMRG